MDITYHFFHWKKGTPFSDDQGIYNSLTWWEQMDNGRQLTRNRKFLTVVPVVLDRSGRCQIAQHAQRTNLWDQCRKSLFDIGFGFAGDVELDCYGKALFMVTISDQPGQYNVQYTDGGSFATWEIRILTIQTVLTRASCTGYNEKNKEGGCTSIYYRFHWVIRTAEVPAIMFSLSLGCRIRQGKHVIDAHYIKI
ncbi:hypothetical protein MUK42_34270 [Musa troglodytarum]|uniref:Uncharacterized protein n=1 Tax=Musa troglodytarum TaxID=320322 RepID=A0A9E7F6R7_9LILI|nr:hypothetical protein MUK42_34043 [Musa troglodytarum]URE41753.1 hypothetical protein MUK42_34270 [Musa troglodytarum]